MVRAPLLAWFVLLLSLGSGVGCSAARERATPDGDVAADGGVEPADAGDRADVPGPSPLARLVAPLSTARVTSRRPTLRFASDATGAVVEICRDRSCALTVATIDVTGASARPATDLPTGVLFWRLRNAAGTAASPTWQMSVGVRSAPVDTSWGTMLDPDGDGHADVAISAPEAGAHGRVYLHRGAATGIEVPAETVLDGPDDTLYSYGRSVASAGDVNGDGYGDLVVGIAGEHAAEGAGGALLHLGGPSGIGPIPSSILAPPSGAEAGFGGSVAGAGDVNRDGYADVAIGAYTIDGLTGAAYVYLGGADGLHTTPDARVAGPAGADAGYFGLVVAGAGDVNGDGYADVVVGAWGAAYVYLGSASGLATSIAASLSSPAGVDGGFGSSVASAGDVNGDGYADLIAGATNETSDLTGRAYVYLGGSSGTASTPATVLTGTFRWNGHFGHCVASAGDVNGDGWGDVMIAAVGAGEFLGDYTGTAYLFAGSSLGLVTEPVTTLLGPDAADGHFGHQLAGAGDINGDGFADVVVGAPEALIDRSTTSGRAYAYFGGPGGLLPAASLIGPDDRNGEFGWSVALGL